MLLSTKRTRKRIMLTIMFALGVIVCGMMLVLSGQTVKAAAIRTAAIDTVGFNDDQGNNNEGWSWNNTAQVLTLEDNFTLDYSAGNKPAITLKANSTIVLKGKAKITSKNKGIETTGNLTVKSATGVNGYLEINLNATGTNGKNYYGIELVNPDGEAGRKLTVTDNSILKINSGDKGNGCIFCSANQYNSATGSNEIVASNNPAVLEVTEKSAVQLIHGTSVARGFRLTTNMSDDTSERVLFIDKSSGNAKPTLEVKTNTGKDLSNGFKNITMMSCTIEGAPKDNTYSLTYNGTDHPILINLNKTILKEKLGIDPVKITPVNFTYYVSSNSEYLNNGADYREKKTTEKKTQYNSFDYENGSELINAAEYKLSYNNKDFAVFKIDQRAVEINGLKAVDKVYDGSIDAAIDYSKMTVECTNDNTDTAGIAAADKNEDGSYKECITPYAKAYFLTLDQAKRTGTRDGIKGLFNDAKTYYESADVEYEGGGTAAQSNVAVKQVYIDKDTDANGVATGITLGNPNYKVHVPSSDTNTKRSQIQASAKIKPRSLKNANVSCSLSHNTVKYREDGYTEGKSASEGKDIYVTIIDKASKKASEPESSYTPYTLQADKDFIMNPNVDKLYEVGEYEIVITGDGNYTGTIKPTWSIERAVRKVTINTSDTRVYDGTPYTIAANTGAAGTPDFNYIIDDVSNNKNVTDSLEENSNLLITYNGKANDGTVYKDSLTAPKEAGTYTVNVSVEETTHYTDASETATFTIHKRTVDLDWFCNDELVDANTKRPDPDALEYNGKNKNYRAVVTNAVSGEKVNVEEIVYNGSAKNGTAYKDSTTAPKEASEGNYSVKATKLSDENYTVEGTAAHNFSVAQREVSITYDLSKSPYTYDASSHIPTWEVVGLVEGDTCEVSDYTLSGKDVFDADYSKATGAVNATKDGSAVIVTVTAIGNGNYKLPASADCKAEYKIVPLNLEDLKVGTWDNHAAEAGSNIWAAKMGYTGALQEPKIMWDSAAGEKELKNEAPKRTKYESYKDEQKNALVRGYNASLQTEALSYSNKTLSIDDKLKGYEIEITGINNFTGTTKIPWNIDILESSIEITNYETAGTKPYTVTYGEPLPEIKFSYINEDIEKDSEKEPEEYVTYTYTGTMKNGKKYGETEEEKQTAPTEAGEYEVTATLAATEHYKEVAATKKFIIAQKEVTIRSGVAVYDKEYDGTDEAQLNFTGFDDDSWEGLLDKDKETVKTALANVAKGDKGYITYTAKFAEDSSTNTAAKDVKWGRNASYQKVVEDKTVEISGYAIDYSKEDTPDVLYNYVIANNGNPATGKAKITPKQISVSGITAKDKVYNGSRDVELIIPESEKMIKGLVGKEKLSLNITGKFADAPGVEPEDVVLDDGKPAAKEVTLIYDNDSIIAGDTSTKAANYKLKVKTDTDGKIITDDKGNEVIDDTAVQQTTNATITPATITIHGVKAAEKTYDGTPKVTLIWDDQSVSITGVCSGDVIELDNTVNNGTNGWTADSFNDAGVARNKYDEVIDKEGTITSAEYDIIAKNGLKGTFNPADYKVADISFTGKINPKKISGITWSFDKDSFSDLAEGAKLLCSTSYTVDKKNLEQIPKAAFESGSGVLAGDSCEPVVKYYTAADKEFANPLNEVEIQIEENSEKTRTGVYTPLPYLEDNGKYVVKVVSTTNPNYVVDETASDITKSFTYDSNADSSELAITNYQKENNKSFTVTYGDPLPKVELSYNNSDIEKEDAAARAAHFTYRYTGKALNGENYDSDKAPVNAGSYEVTVALEATEHFAASKDSAAFIIEPRSVTIRQGISVKDKIYNGTDKATLDFRNIVFDNIIEADRETVSTLFADAKEDYIRYSAQFPQKDVKYMETVADDNGGTGRKIAEMSVTAGNYSFIQAETTPAVLYNYSIARENTIGSLYGKIKPRPVTVSGIRADDKTFDGTDNLSLNLSEMKFTGHIKGDALKVSVKGKIADTNGVPARDVLIGKDGKPGEKKVLLTISDLTAGDNTTNVDNYYLADKGQQTETTVKITPAELTSAKWSFDTGKNLPTAVIDKDSGLITTGSAGTVQLKYYKASDMSYKKPITVKQLNAGGSYVARIEGYSDTNYQISKKFRNPIYPFVYGKKTETAAEKKTVAKKKKIIINLKTVTQKKNQMKIRWTRVSSADGYDVYVKYCSSKSTHIKPVKTVKNNRKTFVTVKKINGKKLNLKKNFTIYVRAYRKVGGKKKILAKSVSGHVAGYRNQKYSNVKEVTLLKSRYTIKTGKTARIKAKVTLLKKNRKHLPKSHDARFRYKSSDTSIATVNRSGRIKGVKKGTCTIYVYSINGFAKKVRVTVK